MKVTRDGVSAKIDDAQNVPLKDWTTSINAAIDTSSVDPDMAGTYKVSLVTELNDSHDTNYVLADDQLYSTYQVKESIVVDFQDITGTRTVSSNLQTVEAGTTITVVSFNDIYPLKTANATFYYRDVDTYPDNDESRYDNTTFEPLEDVCTKIDTTKYQYGVEISGLKLTGYQTIYVAFEEDTKEYTGTGTSESFTMDYIKSVVYTGEKLVLSTDTKLASKKGKALNKRGYTIKVYDANGNDVTNKNFAKTESFAGYSLVAVATGTDPNYTTGQVGLRLGFIGNDVEKGAKDDATVVYGIPAKSKKLSVKFKTKSIDYKSTGVKVSDYVGTATSSDLEAKIAKKVYGLKDTTKIAVDLVETQSIEAAALDTYCVGNASPDTYTIKLKSTGEYTGTYDLKYTVKAVKYDKKAGNISVNFVNGANGTFVYNPAGQDDSYVQVKLINVDKTSKVVDEEAYTLTWKQPKIGTGAGTLTVKGNGKIFSGAVTRTFNIEKADISKSTQVIFADGSSLLGSNKVTCTLWAPSISVNGKTVGPTLLKAGKDYKLTNQSENTSTKFGTVTFDATDSAFYKGKISNYSYRLYTDEVKSVTAVLSENGTVSCDNSNIDGMNKKHGYSIKSGGYEIEPVSVTITTKSGKTTTVEGFDNIIKVFDVTYSNNAKPGKNAVMSLQFIDGKTYPTAVQYNFKYTIS